MEPAEEFQRRWQRARQLGERLRLAAFRLEAAELGQAWAVASPHQQGLSIRAIAAAIRLSPARVHQLLNAPLAAGIPTRLNALRAQGWPVALPDVGETEEELTATGRHSDDRVSPDWPRRSPRCG